MAAKRTGIEDEIRRIVRDGEDVQNGWGDRQIVAEARRRSGGADAPDAESDRWSDLIATIRSQDDNDGQTRGDRNGGDASPD